MSEEEKRLLELAAADTRAIRIGDEILYPPLMVGDKAFQFDPWQNGFLYALQKFDGNIEKACEFIEKPLEWAQKFISTRKFREFRTAKLRSAAVRSGELVDWWWQMGLDGAKGYIEWYEGACQLCHEQNRFTMTEIEAYRGDDMTINAKCKVCFQPLVVNLERQEFKPSREAVQFWSEIGNRLVPKVERMHHTFSSETFVFTPEGES